MPLPDYALGHMKNTWRMPSGSMKLSNETDLQRDTQGHWIQSAKTEL